MILGDYAIRAATATHDQLAALYPERSDAQIRLGRLAMWSIDRDAPCPAPTQTTSNTCSGVPDPAWAFSDAFKSFGSRSPWDWRDRRAKRPSGPEIRGMPG